MTRCIQLAMNGLGSVSPNPMVGAVIVHQDKIIGEGYHQQYGAAHAEVNAIQSVIKNYANHAELLAKSTLYVNLEPCAHFGKTPPCSDLIIQHKIPKVVIGNIDPFEKVNGKGVDKLKAAGIHVVSGIMEEECTELNKRFFTYHQLQRPYIILKWAETKNGFFATTTRETFWITSNLSKKLVHRWRTEESAILIGKTTALVDNPQLTAREWQGKNPIRIVIDKNLAIPASSNLFKTDAKTIVFNEIKTETKGNIQFLELEFNEYLPQFILYQLYLLDVQSVLIEGGVFTLESFISFGLWDEARVLIGNKILMDGIKAPKLTVEPKSVQTLGEDKLMYFRNNQTI